MAPRFRAGLRPAPSGRWGRRIAIGLVGLGSVLAFLSALAIWTERQALDTDQWVQTSARMWEDPEIRGAVSEYLVDQVDENVGLKAEIEEILPGFSSELAAGVTGGARGVAALGVERALDSSAAQTLWEAANRNAHQQLLAVLEDGNEVVSTGEGNVSLDLRGLFTSVAEQVGLGEDLATELPADATRIEVLHSDELQSAQDVVSWIRGLALVLLLLTFACFALAIRLARGGRLATTMFSGVGLVTAGVAVLVLRFLSGRVVVDQLVTSDVARPAGEAAWSIGTSLLTSIAATLVVVGALLVAAAWLGSATRAARALRRLLAPAMRRHVAYAYGLLAVAVAIYLAADPSRGLPSLLTVLFLAASAALGIGQLRRRTLAEFPPVRESALFGLAKRRAAEAEADA